MSSPLGPISPGDPLGPKLKSAAFFNALISGVKRPPPRTPPQKAIQPQPGTITCLLDDYGPATIYKPVAIVGKTTTKHSPSIDVRVTADPDATGFWGIAQETGEEGQPLLVSFFGFCYAEIVDASSGPFVTRQTSNLRRSGAGRGSILVYDEDAPSLVYLSGEITGKEIIEIAVPIPAGTALKPGKGSASLLTLNDAEEYVSTGISLPVYNSQLLATTTGKAQASYHGGKLFVEVSPCSV